MPHTQFFFESIFATTRDAIYVTDQDYRCVMVNQAFCDLTGYTQKELIGRKVASLLVDDMDESMYQQISESINSCNDLSLFESRWRHKNGSIFPVEIRHAVLTNAAGDYSGIVLFVRDITERKAIFEHLKSSHEQLQEKVRERTVNLEEINTALRVVLQDREEEQKTNEDSMQVNVNKLVLPYLNRLKTTRLDERQRSLVAMIESTLKDIVAPFTGRPASLNLSLTPSELQIANMIKQGMSAKEIAVITSLSPGTITCIRSNIRKKLGLVNSKVNLRTYLLSSG
ncbi:MAG: PAS domain S-box protein [Deltaproteobacteria bacterium]|nr:PAS domain S-box protein [Deltaproteobacteria bacterium]